MNVNFAPIALEVLLGPIPIYPTAQHIWCGMVFLSLANGTVRHPMCVHLSMNQMNMNGMFKGLLQHPFLMMNRFLSEAAEKVKTHSSILKEDWGQDLYEAIVASFEDIFESLTKLKDYAWYQVCYQRPPLNALYRRGNSIKRRLFLKLRKLIKLMQCAIDKDTHGQWKIMAPHLFDNPETCLLRFEAEPQPEGSESGSSDDEEY